MIENLKDEVWMTHPIIRGYAASNYGRIKSLEREIMHSDGRVRHYEEQLIKPQYQEKGGYLRVQFWQNVKKPKKYFVHRFCFECFHQMIIPKDRKKYQINHLDENPKNNSISNLELVSSLENINFGKHNERVSLSQKGVPRPYVAEIKSKKVGQYTLEGKLIKVWKSTMEAERNGFKHGCISRCCNGKLKKYKGFLWKYI